MKAELPRCVLVIGSGPVSIGQAAEFDYAGSQACLSLRDEGIRTVLLNSNPATIQTDYSVADRIYIEPIIPETVRKIIEAEKIDAILPSVGGQTALNLAVQLEKLGIIRETGVKILGTSIDSIELAEDRQAFHKYMESLDKPVAKSWSLTAGSYEKMASEIDDMAYILRTSFSLGGTGGIIVNNREELLHYCRDFFALHPDVTLDVEQSLLGMTELEYEMMRDSAGNCISICNMENLDPMGVHTGESIVVTPSLTLTDKEYHILRSEAVEVISSLGIIGACNIQFALDRKSGAFYVVEVNPRTSRSSALASKSSGYPIARVATKLALGYLLHEVRNPITATTFAASEPSLDYITVKIPRWPFDKFDISRKIGVQMKSIGEVMGIGRTFEEALMKAVASLETRESNNLRLYVSDSVLVDLLREPNDRRLYAIFEALFRDWPVTLVSNLTGYSSFFVERIFSIVRSLKKIEMAEMPANLTELKSLGVPDSIISTFSRIPLKEIIEHRLSLNVLPEYRSIDTCSGEFEAVTPYLYSTYGEKGDPWERGNKEKIIIIGSGPNRISQGLEFDYGSVKAVKRIRELGFETVMINSNPETVSTDFDVSDRLFFEPVTLEHVSNIIKTERPKGVIIQFSGQTGQNMSLDLEDLFGKGIILGTSPGDIFRIEERGSFAQILRKRGIVQPEFFEVYNENDSESIISKMQLPVIVRSSFIIGGRAMDIISDRSDAMEMIREALRERPGSSVLISRYIQDATEMDVDFISDGKNASICGIAVHVEEAGTHSGDATMVVGPGLVESGTVEAIGKIVSELCEEFHLVGLSNLQVMLKGEDIFVIELNARASRSIPFISKAYGIDFVSRAVDLMLGITGTEFNGFREPSSYAVKIPVFPFLKFPELDIFLSPEMKSTGEGMALGTTLEESFRKAMMLYYRSEISPRNVLLSVGDEDKAVCLNVARELSAMNSTIYATPGTADYLYANGIKSTTIFKLEDLREPRIDRMILDGRIDLVINTPGTRTRHKKDGLIIRKQALSRGIPVFTNIRFAESAIRLSSGNGNMEFRELAEYHPA